LTLLQERGFRNLYGIDAAQALLDRIPDQTLPTVCDNYLNMKRHYAKHQFDAATIFNTLHHLNSQEEYLRFFHELHCIMKPGATVLVKELRNGLFYKTYNAVIQSRIANRLFPSAFQRRDFVQTEENGMYARFFQDFVGHIHDIMECGGKFKIVKEYRPLTFERLIVMKVQSSDSES